MDCFLLNIRNDHWAGLLNQQKSTGKSVSLGISIYKVILLEFQRPLSHPVSDQGDWRAQPGGGGDGHQVQNGGAGGLDQGSHEREQDDVICFSCDFIFCHFVRKSTVLKHFTQKNKKIAQNL